MNDSFLETRIRLFGVGNAGCRVVESLSGTGLDGTGLAVCNTDLEALQASAVATQIQLGARLTRGMGAGGDPEVGRAAAEEAADCIREACRGAELIFVLSGMGGGTGTGAAPLMARYAHEVGALTLGLTTLPFACEGSRRQRQARRGLEDLKATADVVLTLPNQRVLSLIEEQTSVVETFRFVEALLAEGVRGLWRLVSRPGLINVDFADLRDLLRDRHAESFFAYAETEGTGRSGEIVERLTMNPLLENGNLLRTTGSALVSLVAGTSLTMSEVNRVSDLLRRECEGADLLLGASIDPALGDRLSMTFIGVQAPSSHHEDSLVGETESVHDGPEAEEESASDVTAVEAGFFDRESPPRRQRSRFVAPPPDLSPEEKQKLARRAGRRRAKMKQAMLPLEVVSKGRFEKSEPTVVHGEDLDVPTFVRRGVVFN